MWIKRIRVHNYKSFADSDWLELGPRFNFVIGKNNSGKTALLEAFKLDRAANMPHRDESLRRDAPAPPHSEFELVIRLAPTDISDAFQSVGGTLALPVAPHGDYPAPQVVQDVMHNSGADVIMQYRAGSSAPVAHQYPSHQLFPDTRATVGRMFVHVTPKPDRRGYKVSSNMGGDQDNLAEIFNSSFLKRKIFVFEAERIRNGRVNFASSGEIAPDASNLPRALFEMEKRPVLWETFNQHVNEVLPNVRRVVNVGVGSDILVQLWPVDPVSDRDDLVINLSDSGSGVAQVLSILCAVLTYKSAVICVDEPNNFLHPGAVKALMRILQQYDHQYIVSTHSLEALSSVPADVTHMVEWISGRSLVSPVNAGRIDDNRKLLSELGVSVSDIFGVDRVLWVEGQTEEICFPMLVQAALGYMPSSLAIVRVRSVDEVLRRQGREALVRDVYQRLSDAGGLIPRATSFVFDREDRSEKYISQISEETKGRVRFLPRRQYENYLLDLDALTEELNSEVSLHGGAPVSSDAVGSWMLKKSDGRSSEAEWVRSVDAARVLREMFSDLAGVEYRKTHHSPALTRRLLGRADRPLGELISFVQESAGF